jgi:hypothetical protein
LTAAAEAGPEAAMEPAVSVTALRVITEKREACIGTPVRMFRTVSHRLYPDRQLSKPRHDQQVSSSLAIEIPFLH